VPAIGGHVQNSPAFPDFVKGGAYDQRGRADLWACRDTRPLRERPDVKVFETEPLASPLEVVGPIGVRLWVGSSAIDSDVVVKLIDVYPDGFAMNLSEAILRLRFRNGFERAEPLVPGRDLRSHTGAAADRQPVRGRASHPSRRPGQPLPAVGREPAAGRDRGVPRCRAAVFVVLPVSSGSETARSGRWYRHIFSSSSTSSSLGTTHGLDDGHQRLEAGVASNMRPRCRRCRQLLLGFRAPVHRRLLHERKVREHA
jgi:hypothetical protein